MQRAGNSSRLLHRLSTGSLDKPSSLMGSPHPTSMNNLESICLRLERCVEQHGQKLRNIEYCLGEVIAEKLDRLIDVNVRAVEWLSRMTEAAEAAGVTNHFANTVQHVPEGNRGDTQHTKQHVGSQANIITQQVLNQQSPKREPITSRPSIEDKVQSALAIPTVTALLVASTISPQILSPSDMCTHPSLSTLLAALQNQPPSPIPIPQLPLLVQPFMPYFKRLIGAFCSSLTSQLYQEYASHQLDEKEMKAKYSWGVMDFSVRIDKRIKENAKRSQFVLQHETRMEIVAVMDQTFKNVLEFLIKKYPQSKHKVVDTDLSKYIVDVNRQFDPYYDLVRNSGVSFVDTTGKTDWTREIKVWINLLISETKKVFPIFKNKVKEIFVGRDGSIDIDNEIEYEISSKISETVEPYSDEELELPGLRLKSQQIFRILTKWIQDMFIGFFNPSQKIINNKYGFKSMSSGVPITLPTRRKMQLARKLQLLSKQRIMPFRKRRQRFMHAFLSGIFDMVHSGIEGNEELLTNQVVNSKLSQYLSECGETYTALILSMQLELLNVLRTKYSEEKAEAKLDLVTFGVMDLLRCRCVGGKREIKRVYNQLSNSKDIEIIRVKNKLNQSTRDILINFKVKDTFLVAEMQLALGDCKDQINDHFCHHLYQLQRSFFPVLFQVANQVVSNDPRISYFTPKRPIHFKHSGRSLLSHVSYHQPTTTTTTTPTFKCSYHHPAKLMNMLHNVVPFCCSFCSKFINAFVFSLEYARCPECFLAVCPECLLESYPEAEGQYIRRYVNRDKYERFMKSQGYWTGFGGEGVAREKINRALSDMGNGYALVFQFDSQGPKSAIYKRLQSSTPTVVRAFYTIDQLKPPPVNNSDSNWIVILPLNPSVTVSIKSIHNHQKWLVQDCTTCEVEEVLKRNNVTEVVAVVVEKEVLIIDKPETRAEIQHKMREEEMVRHLISESKRAEANIELTSKELKELSLLTIIKNCGNIKGVNLWENRLKDMSILKNFPNITELHLRQNCIQSITDLLQLPKLQVLNLQNNCLCGNLPEFPLQSLTSLNLSGNKLTNIDSLSNCSSLCGLAVSHNQITRLPKFSLPLLEMMAFDNNLIESLRELSESHLPKLKRLLAEGNLLGGNLQVLPFACLESLHLENNRIQGFQGITGLPELREANVSNNRVAGEVPKLQLPKITKLLVARNRLNSIQNMEFWQLPNLVTLDLSQNQIRSDLPHFSLPSLITLNLCQNQLANIMRLPTLPSLQTLNLCGNLLTCLPVLTLPNLHTLILRQNHLTSLLPLSAATLPRLQQLDLVQNRLTSDVPVLRMPCLASLRLDSNDIGELLCLQERQLVPVLKEISVSGNMRLLEKFGEKVRLDEKEVQAYARKVTKELVRRGVALED